MIIVRLLGVFVFSVFFFFFKQKTAYEMRISDWSSDVCSSDLWSSIGGWAPRCSHKAISNASHRWQSGRDSNSQRPDVASPDTISPASWRRPGRRASGTRVNRVAAPARSEEHTSELQSLMRKSYAVFRLKKKNNKKPC